MYIYIYIYIDVYVYIEENVRVYGSLWGAGLMYPSIRVLVPVNIMLPAWAPVLVRLETKTLKP